MSPPRRHTVRLLRVAEDDLAEIVAYIALERPSAAEALLARIEASLEHLSAHPFLGRGPREVTLARMGYRFLVVEDYLVFYTVEGTTIYVHRILHGARDYLGLIN